MFAALNTIERRVQRLAEIDLFHAEQPWATERRPVVVDAVRMRLAELAVSCYGSVPGLVDAPGSRLVELQRGPVQLGLRARGEIVALREVLTEEAIHVVSFDRRLLRACIGAPRSDKQHRCRCHGGAT
jgi:hypothetical protein